ncbi:hypothetical protein Y032_0069g332 [Ancylostoma ceylanicum]|uniref:G-protein coupled receptors family 1 profile domain-containing protein n=1 Tax=Ancylostoma ceylanicum TaxID=53326 RepID=A0A016TY08_9BILA|nr:hypothetical protein Y032_0069g332 [Ancylostoma ceylanicum]
MWATSNSYFRQLFFAAGVILSTVTVLLVGCILSYSSRNNGYVFFLCGREASFGKSFTNFACLLVVFGYLAAFLICLGAYAALITRHKATSKQNLSKVKLIMVISFISFLLISVPNITFVLDKLFLTASFALKTATFVSSTIAYSLNVVVYVTLSRVFRQHIIQLLSCKNSKVFSLLNTKSRSLEKKEVRKRVTRRKLGKLGAVLPIPS